MHPIGGPTLTQRIRFVLRKMHIVVPTVRNKTFEVRIRKGLGKLLKEGSGRASIRR